MNKQSLTRKFGKATLVAKKNSPHIFFAAGLAGVVTSTVLACRATLKLEKELDQIRTDLDSAREAKALIEESEGAYTQQDYAKELTVVYAKSTFKIAKMYAPAVVVGSISVACLSGSHIQLTRRNAALSSSLALMTNAFAEYRDRVREVVGEEKELDIYRCMQDNELEIDGKKTLVKTKDPDAPVGSSPFAVCFDEKSLYYQNSVEMNRVFIELQQHTANMKLRAYGYVFLNDVYEALGLPKTPDGQLYGWVRFSDTGDNVIDFCAYDAVNGPESRRPYDKSIWLDFNVDGIIYDQIG